MTLRWKHALLAYVLVVAGAALVFTIGMVIEGYPRYGATMIVFWPVVSLVGLAGSLLPFLLFRTVLQDIDDYGTVAIGGAGLGAVTGTLLSVMLIDWPIWLSIIVFGGVAGRAQLWLERTFDRRWPL